tara:strand:- start:8325 stop:8732 length:408 start_codon:yes stop_codon:yes gene_type:complete
MKQLLTLVLLVLSTLTFAQSTGLVVGTILDKELDNTPLAFANVQVKGTDIVSTTDLSGLFLIENLEDGDYTLTCNFAGYEAKELSITVSSEKPAEVKLALGAQTFSLSTLALNENTQAKNEKTVSEANKVEATQL